MRLDIRWARRCDLQTMLEIEAVSFDYPWSEEDFLRVLRQRDCIPMVVDYHDRVIGYMIYELHKERIHLINFAVDTSMRRVGVGNTLLRMLVHKLGIQDRKRITLLLRESNLIAQVFFRAFGFVATKIMSNYYKDPGETAYYMQYRLNPSLGTISSLSESKEDETPTSQRSLEREVDG